MNLRLARISEFTLARLKRHPTLASQLLDDIIDCTDGDPDTLEARIPVIAFDEALNLHREWPMLHFCLCGAPPDPDGPLAYALTGKTQLAEVELGYWPPRYNSPSLCRQYHEALEAHGLGGIRKAFDPVEMVSADVDAFAAASPAAELAVVLDAFDSVAGFYARAAYAGEGVVVFIT